VYAGTVKFLDKVDLTTRGRIRAGIVIGPLDAKRRPKIEAHLIGFDKDVYGRQAVLELTKFIRKFKKFKTKKELIEQIVKDLKKC